MLPAVGYDHPDQSHFTSRHFWEVGATDTRLLTGWMGRYLDVGGSPDNPLQGLSLTGSLEPSLATAKVPVAAIDGPEPVRLLGARRLGRGRGAHARRDRHARQRRRHDAASRTAAKVTAQSATLRRQLQPFGGRKLTPPVPVPGRATTRSRSSLQGLAAMIAAGLPLRCVALEATGQYDTHAGQASELTPALTTTAASLFAFQRDLEARGVADRVLTLVWSEFGRRAQENGSGGTDHGAAGTGFLIGTRAAGTQVGEFPGSRRARPRRQPEGDVRLPRRLRGAARAVAPLRRGARHPGRREVQAADARQVKLAVLAGLLGLRCSRARDFGGSAPSRVQVVAREYSFTLSRLHVQAGTAVIELANFGQDPRPAGAARRGEAHRRARRSSRPAAAPT